MKSEIQTVFSTDENLCIKKDKVGFQASIAGKIYPCVVGKNGFISSVKKCEGDQCTPIGSFPLRRLFFREDILKKDEIKTNLPLHSIQFYDGWCDAPDHPDYNRLVDLRTFDNAVSHEKMWRDDPLYDLVIEVGYNDDPIEKGKGSAIFIHIMRSIHEGTAGCVAFSREDLLEILAHLNQQSFLVVYP